MSGIVGIVNLKGADTDEPLLRRCTTFLEFRGPDGTGTVCRSRFAFGHTRLITTCEGAIEQQPCLTADENVCLVADARIDDRDSLVSRLKAKLGNTPGTYLARSAGAHEFSDAELILLAYEAWGEDCTSHLLGDFAFAIWDGRQQKLFCARDQMGVRQFFYVKTSSLFIFSNTLECLRIHPEVSSRLDETVVGDFLLFGLNYGPPSTIFQDIKRLPAAHTLTLTESGFTARRYWSPSESAVRYVSKTDYVDHFKELLETAIADRLRTTSLGISLSGGLDSSSIAALVRQVGPSSLRVKGFCVDYQNAFRDYECSYATRVAEQLGIEIEALDATLINEGWSHRASGSAPEPFNVDPVYIVSDELMRRVARDARVCLTGWDGDTFMSENPRIHFRALLGEKNFTQLFWQLMRYVYFQKSPPPIGLRTVLLRRKNKRALEDSYPLWLNPQFEKRLNLRERWNNIHAKPTYSGTNRSAVDLLSSPYWEALLARFDPAVTQQQVEVRHPLIDLRVVEYLLAIPIIPWLLDKTILRKAMIGILLDEIRLRPKTTLAGDPGLRLRHSKKFSEIDAFNPVPELAEFIDRATVRSVTGEEDRMALWTNLRPYCLNQWFIKKLSGETR